MKNICLYMIIASFAFNFLLACKKKQNSSISQKHSNEISNTSNNKKIETQNILSADDFANALNQKKMSLDQGKKTLDLHDDSFVDLFQIDPVGQDAFNNKLFEKIKTPFNSLAECLHTKHRYSWRPKWHYENGGGVLIPSIALSADKSILALIESIPGNKGRIDSLLLLINTYNWKIKRIYHFKNTFFNKLVFADLGKSILINESSLNNTEKGRIQLINSLNGKIENQKFEYNGTLDSFAYSTNTKKIFLKLKNNQDVFILNFPGFKTINTCDSGMNNAFLIPGFNNILMIGKEKIKIYNANMKLLNNEYLNPLHQIPDSFSFINNNISEFAFGAYMKKSALFVSGKHRILTEHSGKVLCDRSNIHILAFSDLYKNQIKFLNTNDFREEKSIIPAKIKPKTLAGAIFMEYLDHSGKYVILDSHGNLILYSKARKKSKKWKKHIIFNAKK